MTLLRHRQVSAEEKYFYEQSYKKIDPVESIARIEDVAKFLVGATATTSGLFLSAFNLVLGTSSLKEYSGCFLSLLGQLV